MKLQKKCKCSNCPNKESNIMYNDQKKLENKINSRNMQYTFKRVNSDIDNSKEQSTCKKNEVIAVAKVNIPVGTIQSTFKS